MWERKGMRLQTTKDGFYDRTTTGNGKDGEEMRSAVGCCFCAVGLVPRRRIAGHLTRIEDLWLGTASPQHLRSSNGQPT